MTRMLVTTFQQPAAKLDEALLFKREGLASTLIARERFDELQAEFDSLPAALQWSAAKPGGFRRVQERGTRLLSLLDLTRQDWIRLVKLQRAQIDAFASALYAQPVDVYVVGGHHTGRSILFPDATKVHCQTVWGYTRTTDVLDHVMAVAHPADRNDLYWLGGELNSSVRIEAAQASFRRCKMILVLGCNALGYGDQWQAWAARGGGIKPLILGWNGTVSLRSRGPTYADSDFASAHFWPALKTLVPAGQADGLEWLWRNRAREVAQAWGHACWKAYAGSSGRDRWLWRRRDGERQAAAMLPDGSAWVANPAYAGQAGQRAMIEVQS